MRSLRHGGSEKQGRCASRFVTVRRGFRTAECKGPNPIRVRTLPVARRAMPGLSRAAARTANSSSAALGRLLLQLRNIGEEVERFGVRRRLAVGDGHAVD